ncbi:MAG TPA: iron uptake transporter permease EfeU [Mycobacteriales bacterium]|nr:iron uptake transporter permease EfeU [Mycobacteriales bacterium]
MLAIFLIGLREGLEAALVVSILIAYLVRTGRRDALPHIWLGVGLAVLLSLAFGTVLEKTSAELTFQQQELLGGTLSIVAVGFVTWMVFWMRRTARHLKRDLEGRAQAALVAGGTALAVVAFLAVGREGLETALFLWAAAGATTTGTPPLVSALLGIAVAVLLAYGLYRRSVKLNLARFFTVTGTLLIIVAAGVLAYGIHDLQEAEFLPGLQTLAFDVSAQVPPDSWYGVLLRGTVNFTAVTTVLQAVAWVAYVVPVLFLYFRPQRSTSARSPASQHASV